MALSEVFPEVWQVVLLGDLTIDLLGALVLQMWKIVIVGHEHLDERLLFAYMILYVSMKQCQISNAAF